eukprot:CAMPEP_0198140978 /NCGR_PEP_ID=MMETSP1443-20131203/4055_1 /TAXON_ID=186043 /ORGANISM="Entomoneis sp., Strain CCMP2396" /LENGTH=393 /DNA_ID=CAMNT_0043803571 /DNA_START=258 /DNA_END=1439 /DNA_ORIENTATION=+
MTSNTDEQHHSSSRLPPDDDDESNKIPGSSMSKTSFLSHVMLKVPSVDETVQYWTSKEKGGTIRVSREKSAAAADSSKKKNAHDGNDDDDDDNDADKLMSAFVELGSSASSSASSSAAAVASPSVCFALELVATNKKSYSIGNCISYIGVSMLHQFQIQNANNINQNNDNNKNDLLLSIITGNKPKVESLSKENTNDNGNDNNHDEPNGIPVKSCASAPGDYLARFALQSTKLEETCEFYTTILGMQVKAQDETMLCLRYNDNENDDNVNNGGVPTTLVFDQLIPTTSTTTSTSGTNGDTAAAAAADSVAAPVGLLDMGDCFDHLAIVTTTPIDIIYQTIIQNNLKQQLQPQQQSPSGGVKQVPIFMKPTNMFGKQVLGLIDPNGYKVVLASG